MTAICKTCLSEQGRRVLLPERTEGRACFYYTLYPFFSKKNGFFRKTNIFPLSKYKSR